MRIDVRNTIGFLDIGDCTYVYGIPKKSVCTDSRPTTYLSSHYAAMVAYDLMDYAGMPGTNAEYPLYGYALQKGNMILANAPIENHALKTLDEIILFHFPGLIRIHDKNARWRVGCIADHVEEQYDFDKEIFRKIFYAHATDFYSYSTLDNYWGKIFKDKCLWTSSFGDSKIDLYPQLIRYTQALIIRKALRLVTGVKVAELKKIWMIFDVMNIADPGAMTPQLYRAYKATKEAFGLVKVVSTDISFYDDIKSRHVLRLYGTDPTFWYVPTRIPENIDTYVKYVTRIDQYFNTSVH